MNKFIAVYEHLFDGNEKKYLAECIDNGWIGANGPFVQKVEKEFAQYCGQKYGSCITNGTAALDVTLKSMKDMYRWEDNSEIIVPTFNIISSVLACVYNKLKPIFVDCENKTFNIDTEKIERHLTKNTKAIIMVHMYGLPSEADSIKQIAEQYNLKIIEDAAQAHGLEYKHQKCGSFGDASTFSFFTNKHICSGEGGIVLTSDEEIINKVNYYKNLCFTKEKFIHYDLGQNLRMTNLQAAVIYAQFEKIEKTIKIKQDLGNIYQDLLSDLPVKLPEKETPYAKNNYWVFPIIINDYLKINSKELATKLREKNIETRPLFYPLHKQPIIKKLGYNDNINRPVSENIYNKGLYIPMGLTLTKDDMKYISDCLHQILN